MPVIIYQMGKVASSSIAKTLKNFAYKNIYQPHRILPDNILAYKYKADQSNEYSILEDEEGELISKYKLLNGAKVITLVREPIERNFSAFFQNYKMMTGEEFQDSKQNIDEMIDNFLKNYPHEIPIRWYEDEFNPVMGISIYDYPFDTQKGYSVIDLDETSILVMRSELDDLGKEKALQSFLNDDTIKIVNANQSDNKSYSEAYRSFKSKIVLPESYIDKMYQSEYTKHFYATEEIEVFKQKWNRK